MKKLSDENLRNEIIGLGKKSIRKNYYRSLIEKQKDLEQKNNELLEEVKLRKEAEAKLSHMNEILECKISERTLELDQSNKKLKKTIDELEKSYKYLVEAEKLASLNHLVTGVSHELNTPLGVSLTTTSFISELSKKLISDFKEQKLSKISLENSLIKMDKSSDILLESIAQMTKLIDNFKQIATAQGDYRKVYFRVCEYFQMIIQSMSERMSFFENIAIHTNCNENMMVNSYPGLYAQLLTIFLNNTLIHGFTKVGGTINIEFFQENNHYHFKYNDNGHGLDEGLMTHLFEPFFSTKMNSRTPGLGLFTAYNLVLSLEGSIRCESPGGKGFYIEVIIPIEHTMNS